MDQFTTEIRLGDVIDDHCIKCRRLTNHSIVSIVEGKAAKVRCRTCYHDHDYRNEQAPPSKKELKKLELLAAMGASPAPDGELVAALEGGDETAEVAAEEPVKEPVAPKKTRGRAKRT